MRFLPLVVLASILLTACGDSGDEKAGGERPWELSKLPDVGTVLREFTAPGGVIVKVGKEGEGAEAKRGDVLDLKYDAHLTDGARIEESIYAGVVLGQVRPDAPLGLEYGVTGMKIGEKRRLLVPAGQGWSSKAAPSPTAVGQRLVLDVERIPLLEVEVLDLQLAAGREAKVGDNITAHYRGTLKNGKVFQSSFESGKPLEAQLVRGRLIEGWIRGIPGMRVGGRRILKIPAALAYGKRGKGNEIPANSDLEFEIELVDVK